MPRSRLIRPEFWSDEKLARVSRGSRLTFVGLWVTSDDYGVTKGNAAWLKSQIFPYDDDLKISKFKDWLSELEKLGRILPFSVEGEKYYFIPKFTDHQKVDKPSKTRNPEPPLNIYSRECSESVASYSRESSDETETETETELKQKPRQVEVGFDDFWQAYPKKVGKQDARKAWGRANGTRPPTEQLVAKILQLKKSKQWTKDGGQYVPNPATWINRGGWDDEVAVDVNSCKAPTWDDYEPAKP